MTAWENDKCITRALEEGGAQVVEELSAILSSWDQFFFGILISRIQTKSMGEYLLVFPSVFMRILPVSGHPVVLNIWNKTKTTALPS